MKVLNDYLEKAETYEWISGIVPDLDVKFYLLDRASAYRMKAVKRASNLKIKTNGVNTAFD